MFKITIPTNKSYTGVTAGVAFVDGEGKTDNQWKADWFLENGYKVEEIKEDPKEYVEEATEVKPKKVKKND